MFGIAKVMEKILHESMNCWHTELIGGKVNIKCGIFQGENLPLLLFVLAMPPLTMILRKVKIAYDFGKGNGQINHRHFMDDISIYAKSEKQLESLSTFCRHTIYIFSNDVWNLQ